MSWTIRKAECWRIDAFELWCWRRLLSSLDCKGSKSVNPKENQSWIFIGRTDAEVPILWPPDAKNWLTGKDPDGGKDGDGNGNPLQCSCLENPMDGGAWWAAVYGITQSWTRLKWLSSSSSISERRQEEKGTTKNEMVGGHHQLDGLSLSELRDMVMDRGAWRAAIHGVAKSRTRLSDWTEKYWVLWIWVRS